MLGNIFSSSRSALSPQKTLDLANCYLENARKAKDLEIALVLCDDAEASLSQMKRALRKAHTPETLADQTLRTKIGTVYFEHGKVLENLGHSDKAQVSYKKAEKWGYVQEQARPIVSSRPSSTFESIKGGFHSHPASATPQHASTADNKGSLGRNIAQIPAHIFAQNVSAPVERYDLPQADDHFTSTPQLVYCLSLLPSVSLEHRSLNEKESDWSQALAKDEVEQKRLRSLATNLIREFIEDPLQEATTVAEMVYLAPVLEQEHFKKLIAQCVDGINQSVLLDSPLLEGLAQLIQHTTPGYLTEDDLAKILKLLDARLEDTHGQSTDPIYQLTRTVSHVLDAMADSHVMGVKREALHAPLSAYLEGLKSSDDPYLVYQAAYAAQALLYVPNDEMLLDAVQRIGGKILGGAAEIVSAIKGFDLNGFIDGLKSIQEGVGGIVIAAKTLKEGYDTVMSLKESGQSFLESLQEGYSFDRKSAWYPALQVADQLLQKGRLADFKELVCAAPCRRASAFQWGVCERLAQLAANPLWDAGIRQSALDFLGALYKDDATWGHHANVKQWIIKILMHLADSSERTLKSKISLKASEKSFEIAVAAKTLLKALKKSEDAKKQKLYEDCIKEGKGRCPYTLNVGPPLLASPSLLDRIQNKPDVETDLRKLKRQRLKERSGGVYVSPQAKHSLKARDTALFDLTQKVNDFLDNNQKVMLLLGDSGAGKSTFNRALETALWDVYETAEDPSIPLFINLPAIDKPEQDLIPKQLRKAGFTEPQIRALKEHHKFVLICDGYDESQQTHNLYTNNLLNQPGEWQAQMVISCRSEYIGLDYRDLFQPTDGHYQDESTLFQEAVITPFSEGQIKDYVRQYVSVIRPLWQESDYLQALKGIPHLQDLVKNPFLLTLSLEVLPRLVDLRKEFSTVRLSRVALYDQFVEQWLERGKKRLGKKELTGPEKKAFESLADEGFTQNGIVFLKNLSAAIYEHQAGHPVVEYSHFRDQETWKEAFFSREDEKHLLREALPLNRSGNQYRFIHRSLLEYGVARAVFEPQNKEHAKKVAFKPALARRGSVSSILSFESQTASKEATIAVEQPVLDSPLAKKNFVGEPSVLQFLVERVQQEPLFKQQLLAVIERSKIERTDNPLRNAVRKAAANAITILVRAGVPFNGADLRGIQIPGADLSEGEFDSAQLQGADLRKVNLRAIWLRQANLSGAQMTGVQFGEWPFIQEEAGVLAYAYSPDGDACAIGLSNGNINLYDTASQAKIYALRGHADAVRSVAYSSQGGQFASGSRDTTVRLWDVTTGTVRHTLRGHTDEVNSVAYSPSGDQLASGSWDNTVRLWDVKTGTCLRTLDKHGDRVLSVAYSPQGGQLASGSWDDTVRLWDVKTGTLLHTLRGHTHGINSVAYSPKGDQLASASADSTVMLWNVEGGTWLRTLSVEGHALVVNSVAYSPRGDQLASGSWDNTVRLWDVETGTCLRILSGHSRNVTIVAYTPKGGLIASGSADETVRLWDIETAVWRSISNGHTDWVNSVAYASQGDLIASGSDDETVRLWDRETGALRHTLRGHAKWVNSVAFAPQGGQIASGSWDNTVRLWDVETDSLPRILSEHTDRVRSVAYSPQGDQLASGSHDCTVRLWDVKTGTLRATLSGHTDRVMSLAYSPQGDLIVSGSDDQTVRLWNVTTGTVRHVLHQHTSWLRGVAYSPQGNQIASGSNDQTVRLWDVETGAVLHILKGHTNCVRSVAYSPQGDLIASGSDDHTVRLWDVKTGQCQGEVKCFTGPVMSVAWNASINGTYLVTGGADHSVRRWEIKKEAEKDKVILCWSSTHHVLTVTDTSIEGAHGLSGIKKQLLKQRGAMGEPALRFHQTTRQLSGVLSAAAKFKQLAKPKTLDALPAALSSPSIGESVRSGQSVNAQSVPSNLA
ncbi:pentapeptide repeat-containing protein [Mycoavidus sp. HKI]|uniref:WD40 domain-containing protein n=1 Tax=Mycoavidus sp. HKI TaxID=2840467 RepID=UPI002157D09B|nr:pentapeptide repeat-containing protein [Mycoavidus sp. HKI]UAW64649.2 pentapeptide repeat-containing protein [Mycoavidus sp. HKI]